MRISPASILSYAQIIGLLFLLVPGPGVLAALTRRRQLGASSVIGYAAVKSDETPYIFGRLAVTDDKGATTPRHHTTRKNHRRKRNLQMSISTTAATPNPPPPTPPATEAQPATTVPPPTPPATTTVTSPPPTPPAPTPCSERLWYCAGESGDGGCTNSGDPPDGASTFASAEDCCESEQCAGSDYFDVCLEISITCPHAADAADDQQQTINNVFNDDPDTEVC